MRLDLSILQILPNRFCNLSLVRCILHSLDTVYPSHKTPDSFLCLLKNLHIPGKQMPRGSRRVLGEREQDIKRCEVRARKETLVITTSNSSDCSFSLSPARGQGREYSRSNRELPPRRVGSEVSLRAITSTRVLRGNAGRPLCRFFDNDDDDDDAG